MGRGKKQKNIRKHFLRKKLFSHLRFLGLIVALSFIFFVSFLYSNSTARKSINNTPLLYSKNDLMCDITPACFYSKTSPYSKDLYSQSKITSNRKGIIEIAEAQNLEKSFCVTVPVILYHHIEPLNEARKNGHEKFTVDESMFEEQVIYLKGNGYKTISAEALPQALINRTNISGKPVVITLDDGYSDIYTYAFPIIKKHEILVNLMIAPGLLENEGYLTWRELKEMVDSGFVYAYDHTWSHFYLKGVDIEKAEAEIVSAKNALEENLSIPQKVFTYPWGAYDEKVINVLRKNGFIGAYTTNHSFTQCENDVFTLHRNHVGNAPLASYGL